MLEGILTVIARVVNIIGLLVSQVVNTIEIYENMAN